MGNIVVQVPLPWDICFHNDAEGICHYHATTQYECHPLQEARATCRALFPILPCGSTCKVPGGYERTSVSLVQSCQHLALQHQWTQHALLLTGRWLCSETCFGSYPPQVFDFCKHKCSFRSKLAGHVGGFNKHTCCWGLMHMAVRLTHCLQSS